MIVYHRQSRRNVVLEDYPAHLNYSDQSHVDWLFIPARKGKPYARYRFTQYKFKGKIHTAPLPVEYFPEKMEQPMSQFPKGEHLALCSKQGPQVLFCIDGVPKKEVENLKDVLYREIKAPYQWLYQGPMAQHLHNSPREIYSWDQKKGWFICG